MITVVKEINALYGTTTYHNLAEPLDLEEIFVYIQEDAWDDGYEVKDIYNRTMNVYEDMRNNTIVVYDDKTKRVVKRFIISTRDMDESEKEITIFLDYAMKNDLRFYQGCREGVGMAGYYIGYDDNGRHIVAKKGEKSC